jgi:hypothetical protein
MNRRWPPLLLVPTMLLLFAGLGAAVHSGTPLQPPTCQQLQFHVALAPGLPARYKAQCYGSCHQPQAAHADAFWLDVVTFCMLVVRRSN